MIRGDLGPASPAQHGMWLTERVGAGGLVHHMPLAVWLDGPLDVEHLLADCAAMARRHPLLGAVLVERGGELRLAPGAGVSPIAVAESEGGWLEREIRRGFDLARGPLARFTLVRLGPGRHVLLVVVHHAVFDGASKDILLRDLAAAYNGRSTPVPLRAYAEAAAEERARIEAKMAGAARFWRPRWRETGELALPGLVRPSVRPGPAEAVDLVLGDGLADTAKRLKVTRFELLLTTLHVLLRAYGNERPVVAVDLSTRTRASRDLIGPFVNELPVATEPRGTFAEFARWVRGELRAMYAYREVPIARALGGISPRSALAPVSFSYRQRTAPGPVFAGLETRVEWMMANGAVRNTLHLQVVDGPGGPAARLLFNPELLSRDDCARIGEDLCGLLLAAGEHPGAALEDLPLPTRVAAAAQAPRADTGLPAYAEGADAGLIGEVCAIWREVMALDAVEPGDDLFDLGGHSLTITEIIGRVRDRMGVEVPFEVFIDDPTPTGVAAEIAALLGGDAEEDRC